MRAALARLDLAAVLAILRASTGLTQTDVAELVPGWTQSMVARMESGARGTLFDIRSLLAFADAIDMPRAVLLPLIMGDPDATLEKTTLPERTPVTEEGLVAPGWMAPPPERVTGAHLRYLRSSIDVMYVQEQSIGGGNLLREGVHLFNRARSMLDHSEYGENVSGRLLTLCAELGMRAGFLAYDSGRQLITRRLLTESILLADSAGDPALSAHVHAVMALQCSHLSRTTGRPGPAREALRLLDRAAHLARYEPSARLRALLEMRRAPAAALLGDEVGARRAIARARHELDRGPHDSDPSWASFITEAEITGHEARALLDLGKPRSALPLYRRIVSEGHLSPRNLTFYRALLAETLLRTGDTSDALREALHTLPSLESGIASPRALALLRPLRDTTEHKEFTTRFDTIALSLSIS